MCITSAPASKRVRPALKRSIIANGAGTADEETAMGLAELLKQASSSCLTVILVLLGIFMELVMGRPELNFTVAARVRA